VAFGILGPLEVLSASGPVALPAARLRVVLAALLLRANMVVAVDDIIDSLWPQRAPATAREQVLTVVSALRRVLGDTERPAETRLLVTRNPGYLLRIAPRQLDAQRFEELLRTAERELTTGRVAQAAATLRDALALWRGRALADVPGPLAVVAAQRLEELRLSAMEKLVDVEFRLGRHRDLVPQLTRLVAEHPLRERLRGQLMLALDAAGRRAEALEVYRAGRRLMVTELGLEPGAELRSIERAILADADTNDADTNAEDTVEREASGDTDGSAGALDVAATSSGRTAFPPACPAHLPPDVTDFTGRGGEIEDICRRLAGQSGQSMGTAVPVVAISGQPGVGKSALANRVGHLVRAGFPDGQLHVTLRGTQERPEDPAKALVRMIAALGPPTAMIPEDLDERTRLYRTLTAERRVLVVLDDAATAAQVRPLLPGGPGCGVIVTSRGGLADLAGAHHVRLDVLLGDEALALLAATAGPQRVAAEPEAAQRLLELCGRLPLAVRIAGAKLASRPHWSLGKLAERLADQHRRLDELRVGDLEVRASLELSFRGLDPEADAAARRLALLDAPDFPAWVAACVLATPVAAAEDLIDRLMERQILQYAGPDGTGYPRFRFHDLIQLYLRERARAHDAEPVRQSAVTAGLQAWLRYGLVAMRHLPDKQFPGLEREVPAAAPLDPTIRAMAVTDPLGWYEAESDALLAAVRQAYDWELDELCTGLAHVVSPYLEMRTPVDVWRSVTDLASRAADRAADTRLRALAALHCSRADEHHAIYSAAGHAKDALALFERLDDDLGTAHALNRLTYLNGYLGRVTDAQATAERALALADQVGSQWCRARALQHLGTIAWEYGRLDESERHLTEAISLYGECGGPSSQAHAMKALGRVYVSGGDAPGAIRQLTAALSVYRELRNPIGEVLALADLTKAHQANGQAAEAAADAEEALTLAASIDTPFTMATALSAVALVHQGAGRLAAAADCLTRAVDGFRYNSERWAAKALLALGDIRQAQGDHAAAHAAWQEASRTLHATTHPIAADADARLSGLHWP
jgi:DNA-binding SARP family transcriptional activator/tetratricopeptide (TPR) repeat protein